METIKSFYFILWAIIALYMFVSAKKARFFVLHHRGFFQLYDCMVRYEQFFGNCNV